MHPDLSSSLAAFVAWCGEHIRGDEKGEAPLFLDHLFRAFGHAELKEAGASCEDRVKKDGGGTAFADLLQQLLDLNREVAARVGAGETATAPGLPSFHPDPLRLVSSDCLGATLAR